MWLGGFGDEGGVCMELWQLILLYVGLGLVVLLAAITTIRSWRSGAQVRGMRSAAAPLVASQMPNPALAELPDFAPEELERSKLLIHGLLMSISQNVDTLMTGVGQYTDQLKVHKSSIRRADTLAAIKEIEQILLAEVEKMGTAAKTYRGQLQVAHETIQTQQAEMEKLSADASMDYLTRVPNRRGLEQRLNEALALYKRHGRQFGLLMLDIDHFKALNDTYGHIAGDKLLRALAGTLVKEVRGSDFVARYGGEEFAILLPETSIQESVVVAEKLRAAVEHLTIDHGGETIRTTVSIGIADVSPTDVFVETVVARADAALYGAKSAGRNRVLSQSPHVQGE